MEHLEAAHRWFEFASAAGYLGAGYLVEARVAAEDEGPGTSGASVPQGFAHMASEFRRRYPSWQAHARLRLSCTSSSPAAQRQAGEQGG